MFYVSPAEIGGGELGRFSRGLMWKIVRPGFVQLRLSLGFEGEKHSYPNLKTGPYLCISIEKTGDISLCSTQLAVVNFNGMYA